MHDVGYWAGEFVLSLEIDYMHPAFAEFYDLSPADWTRATLTIGVDPPADLFFSAGGSLRATPSHAVLTPTPVPEPATLLLLGSGLAGMGWLGKGRRKPGQPGPAV